MMKSKTNSKRNPKDSSSRVSFSEGRLPSEYPSTKKSRTNKEGDSTQENESSQGFTTPISDIPKGFKEGNSSVSAHSRTRGGKGRTFLGNKQSTPSPTTAQTSHSLSVDVNNKLPARLFSSTNLPEHGRLNIYSKPEYLGKLVKLLQGSPAWDRIINSQFGKLFELPVSRCAHSAKLIHGMLSRQLITQRKHELWFVYGGFPVRFSLREFHIITGLHCNALPSESEVEAHQDPSYLSVWNRLFGAKKIVTVTNVLDQLAEDKFSGGSKPYNEWKELSLALLVIIDGVIAVNNKLGRVTARYVEMLHDMDFFLSFPWGREAYNQTIKRFGPVVIGNKPDIEYLKTRLRQSSTCCYGFPVALQLQVLETIPVICDRLKGSKDLRNFLQHPSESLTTNHLLRESQINKAELLPTVSVKYTVFTSEQSADDNFSWPDEVTDPKVDLLLSMLHENHCFRPQEWPVFGLSESNPNSHDLDDDDVIDITPPSDPVGKKPQKSIPFPHKPLTRSEKSRFADKSTPTRKQPSRVNTNRPPQGTGDAHPSQGDFTTKSAGDHPSSVQFATKADILAMKEWMIEHHDKLRLTIREDIQNLRAMNSVYQKDNSPNAFKPSFPHVPKGSFGPDLPQDTVGAVDTHTPGSGDSSPMAGFPNAKNPLNEDTNVETQRSVGDNRWDFYGVAESITRELSQQNPQHLDVPHSSALKVSTQKQGGTGSSYSTLPKVEGFDFHAENLQPQVPISDTPLPQVAPGQTNAFPGFNVKIPASSPHHASPITPLSKTQDLDKTIDGSSHPNLKFLPISSIIPVSPAVFLHETIKIRQPVPCKRVPKRSRYLEDDDFTADPRMKALFRSRTKPRPYSPFPLLDEKEFQTFKSYLEDAPHQQFTICTAHTLSNLHFLDIATKDKWLDTEHMQVITSMILRRRVEVCAQKRYTFLDTWFLDLLATHHEDFMKCEDKETYMWGASIKSYVTGKSTGKLMKSEFLTNVDVIYVPMNWGCSHWVGLVINLSQRNVQILDCFTDPTIGKTVGSLIAPVTECIPWLLKRYLPAELSDPLPTTPFTWNRIGGLSKNNCDGDCGPISAKFLEFHAHGLGYPDMAAIYPADVERFRKVYAMDTYETFVGRLPHE